MRPANINNIAHSWLEEYITPDSIAVDATVGNGKDTAFLAARCGLVYGFDIQLEALMHTRQATAGFDNVILFLAGHQDMDRYITAPIDLAVFNLGYLPHGDPGITTTAPTTLVGIVKAQRLLRPGGILSLTFYIGHPEGRLEHEVFLASRTDRPELTLIRTYTYAQRHDPPIVYLYQKH